MLCASDVLLLNEAPTITDMSLPSKLTAYEASGRPILGAVVPGGNTSKVLANLPNALQVKAGDPSALAHKISEVISSIPAQANTESNNTRVDNNLLRNARVAWVESLLAKS